MTKGDQFTIEWDVKGMIWEVDVEFTGRTSTKGGKVRCEFQNLADPDRKPYKMTRKQFEQVLCTEDDWSMLGDEDEVKW